MREREHMYRNDETTDEPLHIVRGRVHAYRSCYCLSFFSGELVYIHTRGGKQTNEQDRDE